MKFLREVKKEKIKGKTCLLRLDLNIEKNELKDSLRLERAAESTRFLLKIGCRVVILSYKGQLDIGKVQRDKFYRRSYSLRPVTRELSRKLRQSIDFVDDLNPKNWERKVNQSKRRIVVLENLRFYGEENKNSIPFAHLLASLGDFYVNDAFSMSHRQQTSLCAITRFLPSYAGIGLEKELVSLNHVLKNYKKPLVLVLGGAKVSDKAGVIENLYPKTKHILCGGGVANTFLFSQNIPVGNSLVDRKIASQNIYNRFKNKIILPSDVVIKSGAILDIGPKTTDKYSRLIKKAGTIIWGGPMGRFEDKKFAKGTFEIAKTILKSKCFAVIGGGETTTAFRKAARMDADQNADKRRYISDNLRRNQRKSASVFLSTGGGAMLEYLAGRKLPALQALDDSNMRM